MSAPQRIMSVRQLQEGRSEKKGCICGVRPWTARESKVWGLLFFSLS